MDRNRIPKQALRYRPKGRRNIGRPKKRWRDKLHFEDQGTGNTPNPSGTWWWWWWWVAGNDRFYLIPASNYFISQYRTSGDCKTRGAPADIVQARLQATKEENGFKRPFAISNRIVWYIYLRIPESDWLENGVSHLPHSNSCLVRLKSCATGRILPCVVKQSRKTAWAWSWKRHAGNYSPILQRYIPATGIFSNTSAGTSNSQIHSSGLHRASIV